MFEAVPSWLLNKSEKEKVSRKWLVGGRSDGFSKMLFLPTTNYKLQTTNHSLLYTTCGTTPMLRWLRYFLLTVIALSLLGVAVAQRVQCQPRSACNRPVTFTPTSAEYSNAIGGFLNPDLTSPNIKLKLKRDKDEPFTAELSRTSWSPANNIELEARFTLLAKKTPTQVTAWLPVSELPLQFLQSDDKRTDIEVEYRLRISGQELAGSYETTVQYFVWDARDKKNKKDTVTHQIRVEIPPFLQLRIGDILTSGGVATIYFDYAEPNALDYVRAIENGTPLELSSSEVSRVEVAANNPRGYTVRVSVTQASGPVGSGLGVADILLFDSPADGQSIRRDSPTVGFETLVLPEDFTVFVDGDEEPGSYVFAVEFNAEINP